MVNWVIKRVILAENHLKMGHFCPIFRVFSDILSLILRCFCTFRICLNIQEQEIQKIHLVFYFIPYQLGRETKEEFGHFQVKWPNSAIFGKYPKISQFSGNFRQNVPSFASLADHKTPFLTPPETQQKRSVELNRTLFYLIFGQKVVKKWQKSPIKCTKMAIKMAILLAILDIPGTFKPGFSGVFVQNDGNDRKGSQRLPFPSIQLVHYLAKSPLRWSFRPKCH